MKIYKIAKVKYPLEYLINETKLPFRFRFFNFISMNFLDEFVSIFSIKWKKMSEDICYF